MLVITTSIDQINTYKPSLQMQILEYYEPELSSNTNDIIHSYNDWFDNNTVQFLRENECLCIYK